MESQDVYTRQQRIAELAGQTPRFRMVSLNQYLDMDWMREAYRLTRKSGAPGVDGMTAVEYERNLETNLADLLERAKSGRYQAPPVRRVYIPKGQHEKRPLGIPTLEDKILQRAVVMLLHAGVLEDGVLTYPEAGTPQGGVISPLLSNIYLHEVLDVWFERDIKPRLRGKAFLIRFADDFVRRTTRRERFTRALQNVREYCRKTMAEPVREQWKGLCVRMRGHYGFYGITGNARALSRYRYMVGRIWWHSLNRRSGHDAKGWEWFNRKILPRYPLPPARVVHSVYA